VMKAKLKQHVFLRCKRQRATSLQGCNLAEGVNDIMMKYMG